MPGTSSPTTEQRDGRVAGWINVVVASLAMTATLPGRTHGLGLVNEQVLTDLNLTRTDLADINFWTSLVGALFAAPAGFLIDRFGVRRVLLVVAAGLGAAVWGMSRTTNVSGLFVWLVAIRGLGQSALSVVSIAIVGKWFGRKLGPAMGAFSVLLTIGFVVSVLVVGERVRVAGWRDAWWEVGVALLVFAPIGAWLTRSARPMTSEPEELADGSSPRLGDLGLTAALLSPAFWICLAGTALFNLVWSAVTFWSESLVREIGFDANTSVNVLAMLSGAGLIANLIAGALAKRERIGVLLGTGLVLLGIALVVFPYARTSMAISLYATAVGLSGGILTVVFFAAWSHFFGRTNLGRIQGVAQVGTVLASALGPELFAWRHAATGSYLPVFLPLAAACGLFAVSAFLLPIPIRPPLAVIDSHEGQNVSRAGITFEAT
jgi:MFS family permease